MTATSARPALVEAQSGEVVEEKTLGDALRDAAAQAPDVLALVEGLPGSSGRTWTYAELLAHSEHTARAMLSLVEPGEKIAIWAHNVPEWILVQMGAALAGVTLVTVNPALRMDEARHVLRQSGAAVVIHVDDYRGFDVDACVTQLRAEVTTLRDAVPLSQWDRFLEQADPDRELPVVSPDDLVQIQYTSGTTGLPKGAALRHRGILNNARLSYGRHLHFAEGEALVNAMPLFHTAGSCLMVLACLQARSTLVLMPAFDPALQLELIESYRSPMLGGVPTMLRAMLTHPRFATTDLSSLRYALSGGSFVEAALVDEVQEQAGIPLVVIYAQTEASPGITMTRFEDEPEDRRSTVGRPLPGIDVRVTDPSTPTRTVAVGEVGEICTRGYHVMAGYHDDAERTAEAIDVDGWLHTGDLASMDERGYVTIRGRLKDMIIRGGENIYPSEIEGVLAEHPAVAQSAVIGVAHEYWGEEVAAYVQRQAGATAEPADLVAYLKQRLAPHKVPVHWWFLDEFPMTSSGKILKTDLRQMAARN